jgi:hypothetical protein
LGGACTFGTTVGSFSLIVFSSVIVLDMIGLAMGTGFTSTIFLASASSASISNLTSCLNLGAS